MYTPKDILYRDRETALEYLDLPSMRLALHVVERFNTDISTKHMWHKLALSLALYCLEAATTKHRCLNCRCVGRAAYESAADIRG